MMTSRLLLLSLLPLIQAQELARQTDHLAIRSAGVVDFNGTAVYGVYVAAKDTPLDELVITARVPQGARFLESTDVPSGAEYLGVADNQVWWSVRRVDPNTLVGPFNFRVKLDGSGTPLPARVEAAAIFAGASEPIVVDGATDPLPSFATEGTLSVDARGTLNSRGENVAIPVGSTGVSLFLPADALTQRVTFTIERLTVDGQPLPAGAEDTWWCGRVRISSDPQVSLRKPMSVIVPARRLLLPGIEARGFIGADKTGTTCLAAFDSIGCSGITTLGTLGFGVATQPRTLGITDGTSNTLLPYIEQDTIRKVSTLLSAPPSITTILSRP